MTNNEPLHVRTTVVLDVRVDDPSALTAAAERAVLSGAWADLALRDEVLALVRSSPAEALV